MSSLPSYADGGSDAPVGRPSARAARGHPPAVDLAGRATAHARLRLPPGGRARRAQARVARARRARVGGRHPRRPARPRASWPGSPPTGRCSSTASPTPRGRAGRAAWSRTLLDLIDAYERWVEAREGREGRIRRSVAAEAPRPAPGQRPRRDAAPAAAAPHPARPRPRALPPGRLRTSRGRLRPSRPTRSSSQPWSRAWSLSSGSSVASASFDLVDDGVDVGLVGGRHLVAQRTLEGLLERHGGPPGTRIGSAPPTPTARRRGDCARSARPPVQTRIRSVRAVGATADRPSLPRATRPGPPARPPGHACSARERRGPAGPARGASAGDDDAGGAGSGASVSRANWPIGRRPIGTRADTLPDPFEAASAVTCDRAVVKLLAWRGASTRVSGSGSGRRA